MCGHSAVLCRLLSCLLLLMLIGLGRALRPRATGTGTGGLLGRAATARGMSAAALKGLDGFAKSTRNSLLDYLVCEEGAVDKDPVIPRQVYKAHWTPSLPEPGDDPVLVIASTDCAKALGLSLDGVQHDAIASAFSGLTQIPGLDEPYATNYGCHVYGQWFGQLGDGRAINLGEVEYNDQRFELQLKGGGRSPFSRGFDGKAVLRSCVREFLASESFHHMGVPTTRALTIVATRQAVRRAWYVGATTEKMRSGTYDGRLARPSGGSFPPDRMNIEPGAVMTRVSTSFIRVAQLELFAQRGEMAELARLADYACFREFPHLLADPALALPPSARLDAELVSRVAVPWAPGHPRRYVELFRCICRATAFLVGEWIRVGYVQGNMNSDNMLVCGKTLDYGPYGVMEKYDPLYQPFTSDADGKFAFMRQPSAMLVNMVTLAQSLGMLIDASARAAGLSAQDTAKLQQELAGVGEKEFPDFFHSAFCEVRRRKLGLAEFRDDEDNALWKDLDMLLYKEGVNGGGGVDWTIFFRELSVGVAKDAATITAPEALAVLQSAFYEPETPEAAASNKGADVAGWTAWLERYLQRLRQDDARSSGGSRATQREAEMTRANPKYILRNWMAVLAYEAAEKGDLTVLNELHDLLQHPCEEQSAARAEKWYTKTPDYARAMPGVKFMS